MKGASISWHSRAVRYCLPDIAVTVPLVDGCGLRVSIKRHVGLLRKHARAREYAIALRLANLTGTHGVIYDIGANIGLYTIAFAANRSRTIHSFEPSKVALPYLLGNVSANRLPNVNVHPVLLSDAPGTLNFVLDQITTAQSHVGDASESGTPVDCIDLDSYVREHLLPAPDLVKIDVEGHDLPVLRGMANVLSAKPAIYVDGGMRAANGQVGARLYLAERGYSIWNLERMVRLSPDAPEYSFLAIHDA